MDLALETSRREASVALGVGATILAAEVGLEAHASDLLPCLDQLLVRAGTPRGSGRLPLAALFVGLGPGSYTGLRVGLATALGLARASGAALHGLCSFEVLAWEALAPGEEAAVAQDARAGRFYLAHYRRTRDEVEVLLAPHACTARELVERCGAAPLVLGHAGLAEAAGLDHPAVRTDLRPSAEALLRLGRARAAAGRLLPQETLEPLYLMSFGSKPNATGAAHAPRRHAGR